jgi:hypothetical protein
MMPSGVAMLSFGLRQAGLFPRPIIVTTLPKLDLEMDVDDENH